MTAQTISTAFVAARRAFGRLDAYPGDVPATLEDAYAVQELSIAAWPDTIAGWKVALVQPQWQAQYTAPRLAGPIFAAHVHDGGGAPARVRAFPAGFAAVEAEFVVRIARDIPLNAAIQSDADLAPYLGAVHAGIEWAASPLASLNAEGPGAVASDLGNNAGLILGPELAGFAKDGLEAEASRTEIDGAVVGEGSAANVPDGPYAAVRFLIAHLATRGRTLGAGDWVSTGASTGIHPIAAGQTARCVFRGDVAVSVAVGES
ncbi:2-keto-4-pentenoate hydratase [Marinivivus vitaminiproducens]|uniref:2-keto-4-pentenoate hydratase n=1 Tax=Marinivivus vitaminiproducens TaxID=3035935 RepID=UPI0027A2B369|nr:2-keto-4-pentenoate hydratase [Geminicoccaceae bacterium SCSIO 64248]